MRQPALPRFGGLQVRVITTRQVIARSGSGGVDSMRPAAASHQDRGGENRRVTWPFPNQILT
jgi:hypothetical protein